jgi:hypothetical protein
MKNSTVNDNASSIAQSVQSQLGVRQVANKTKSDLKSLLKNIDTGKYLTFPSQTRLRLDKQGKIKGELFFQMLELHKVHLTVKDKAVLQKMFANGDQIKYKEAIAQISIDLELAARDELKWTVSKPESKTVGGLSA